MLRCGCAAAVCSLVWRRIEEPLAPILQLQKENQKAARKAAAAAKAQEAAIAEAAAGEEEDDDDWDM